MIGRILFVLLALLWSGCFSGPIEKTSGIYLSPDFVWGAQGIDLARVEDQRVTRGDTFPTGYAGEKTIGEMDSFSVVLTNNTPRQLVASLVLNPKIRAVKIQQMEVRITTSSVAFSCTSDITLEIALENGATRVVHGYARETSMMTTPTGIADRVFRDSVADLKLKLDSI